MIDLFMSGDFRVGYFCGGLSVLMLLFSLFLLDSIASFVTDDREQKRRQRILDAYGRIKLSQKSRFYQTNQHNGAKIHATKETDI